MSSKRVMVLGAAGQMGRALAAQTWPPEMHVGYFTRAQCDITDHPAVQTCVQDFKPDLIINAAGMTAVDKCETEQTAAVAANFEAPANLAAQCSALDIPLIHLSTDYVFDGRDGEVPYKPYDKMNPLSVYGNTKMMGEEAIRHELAWHVILRVSSVFSAFGANLLTKTLQFIDTRDELKFVTDQKSCPTYAPDIASALVIIATAIMSGKSDGFGTFHFCGDLPVTRLEFVEAIMAAYLPYTERRPTLLPALSADFKGFAERPAYSVLDCSKTCDTYGIVQTSWHEGLKSATNDLMTTRSART